MSWFDWIPTALNIGGTLLNRSMANDAIKSATQAQVDAANRGAQAEVDASNAAKGYYAKSAVNDQAMQQQAAPGVYQQQQAIQQQNTLTPAQQMAIDNARRQSVNTLNGGNLRGSARATVAAVKNVDDTMRGQYMDQNRGRADTAASALSSQYFTSGRDINTQNSNAATAGINAGKAVNTGLNTAGDATARGDIGVGQQNVIATGQAINDIASQIAADNKKHQSSYTSPTGSV